MTCLECNGIGIVVIGRNEGARLRACLQSISALPAPVVYVDSGSADDSVAHAKSLGIEVVELDGSDPCTAARSRNAGARRLLQIHPHVRFIQFIDGDCMLNPGWLGSAVEALTKDDRTGVVCGRRRERFPNHSVYNRLCDMEWNTPIGPAQSCGGDALMRIEPFEQVGGFDATLIAGEEPEMCLRMRRQGWSIERIDCDMTLHDARMTRFSQWWKRTVRSGHAYAEGMAMHGSTPDHYCVRAVASIVAWTMALPLAALGLASITGGWSLLLLLAFFWLWLRVRMARIKHGDAADDADVYALFCVIGKFAQVQGAMQYWFNRLRGRRTKLIEYKGGADAEKPMRLTEAPGG